MQWVRLGAKLKRTKLGGWVYIEWKGHNIKHKDEKPNKDRNILGPPEYEGVKSVVIFLIRIALILEVLFAIFMDLALPEKTHHKSTSDVFGEPEIKRTDHRQNWNYNHRICS